MILDCGHSIDAPEPLNCIQCQGVVYVRERHRRRKRPVQTLSDARTRNSVKKKCARNLSGVYFVQSEGPGGPIKIGYAQCPIQRLSNLRTSSAYELELLGVLPGEKFLEQEVHNRFRKDSIRGEWFKDSVELRKFIELVSEI